MTEKELHGLLARQGIRLFDLALGKDRLTFIHNNKTVEEWRADVRRYIQEIKHRRDRSGWADDDVFNEMVSKLNKDGYHDVTDVVSDVYEGRVAVYSAAIEDAPAHEELEDGFGHYGWEGRNET